MALRVLKEPAATDLATAVVFAHDDDPPFLVRRSTRALRRAGVTAELVGERSWRAALAEGVRWFVRAGLSPVTAVERPPASRTGLPVALLGFACDAMHRPRLGDVLVHPPAIHERLLATGGDLSREVAARSIVVESLVVDERMAELLAATQDARASLEEALHAVARARKVRVLHAPALDAVGGRGLRVAELVTSAQIGGAEHVARSLAEHLPRTSVTARLFTLGSPTRERLTTDAELVDLAEVEPDWRARVPRLLHALATFGADVVHAHLFDKATLDTIAEAHFPLAVSIHNTKAAWPAGTLSLSSGGVALLVACASAVEAELRDAAVAVPVRTVRNGISASAPCAREEVEAARSSLGLGPTGIVVLIVANPRPQKRLDLVPLILERLRTVTKREVGVLWAGAPSRGDVVANELTATFVESLRTRAIPLMATGATAEVEPLRRAADVMLVTSAWEGLSLAQLEAIASPLRVVATDVGGTREILDAYREAGVEDAPIELVPSDATPEDYVSALARAVSRGPVVPPLPDRFTMSAMTRGSGRLLRRAASRARDDERPIDASGPLDVVFVTNNFSPGGAQTSLRRLILGMRARGHRVASMTLQETALFPTPGFEALSAIGAAPLRLPPGDPALACEAAMDQLDRLRPRAIVFWNAIAEHKVLLADLAWDIPVFDVSPGEMYFASLARYFAAPRPDVASSTSAAYGARLTGAVVKYEGEVALARDTLRCPVRVIPNGVPIRADARASSPTTKRIGTSVRIHPDKHLERLLDAFREVHRREPSASLSILGTADAGADAYAAALRESTRDLPVRWLGFVDRTDAFLDTLDVFALVAEPAGCPNASLEAMARGLPICATDVGGMREQIGEDAGTLVARADVPAFAEALHRMVTDAPFRDRCGKGALGRARALFSVERMIDDYVALLGPSITR